MCLLSIYISILTATTSKKCPQTTYSSFNCSLKKHFADDVSLDVLGSVVYDGFVATIHIALHLCMILVVNMKL